MMLIEGIIRSIMCIHLDLKILDAELLLLPDLAENRLRHLVRSAMSVRRFSLIPLGLGIAD